MTLQLVSSTDLACHSARSLHEFILRSILRVVIEAFPVETPAGGVVNCIE